MKPRLSLLVLTLLTSSAFASCAHPGVQQLSPSIQVVDLSPTVDGRSIPGKRLSFAELAATPESRVGVAWPGGSVLAFADRTICVRRPKALGLRINGEKYDSSDDIGARLIRLDVDAAEVRAIERGAELAGLVPWVLVTISSATERAGAGNRSAALGVGRRVADQLVAVDAATQVIVAIVGGTTDKIELELAAPDASAQFSDRMGVVVEGPALLTPDGAINVLLRGPESNSQFSVSALVSVWSGPTSISYQQPPASDARRDTEWLEALASFTKAIENGCELR